MGRASQRDRKLGEIRRLTWRDQPQLRAHLLRLDPVSRYDRFGMSVNDRFLTEYAAHCFDKGALIFGYFVDGVMRGVGELRGLGQNNVDEAAEAAFSIEKAWRSHGIGSALLEEIVETARNIGARTLYITCQAQNRAMQKMVRKLQLQLRFDADPVAGLIFAHDQTARDGQWRECFKDNSYHAMLDLASEPSAQHP